MGGRDGTGPVEPARGGRWGGWQALDLATRFRFTVAALVVVVWCVVYARAALDAKFHPPPEVSALMLSVAAWLFTGGALREIDKAERNGHDDD